MLRAVLIAMISAWAAPLCAAGATAPDVSARFVPANLPPARAGAQETVAVALRTTGPARTVTVRMSAPGGVSVLPEYRKVQIGPAREAAAFFVLRFSSDRPAGDLVKVLVDGREAGRLRLGQCYDLEAVRWKAMLDKDGVGVTQGWMKPEFDDSAWGNRFLPTMWSDIGVTYLRTSVLVPESWRGRKIHLSFRAIDDNDVCYLNGVEVGRTDGWDRLRDYAIDPKAVRFGGENLLCVAANNIASGGGVYRSPSYLGVTAPRAATDGLPVKLAPAGPVGDPMPFRPMRVENGVLLYEDGGEVALWGVNYYPQSWYQYDNMKRLGTDMKKAIRDDLDDMKRMGVQVIRIHVFDREISDRLGNLLSNEHLDLLDYLISEGSSRGIYFMFTPIAWWGGPNENPDSFSARTPKEYMFCDDAAIQGAANYLKNWLNHTNAYTGRRYKDEPAICALEIMNEPAYADYNLLVDPVGSYYKADPQFVAPFKKRLLAKWGAWCKANGIREEQRFFPLFRYQLMGDYLDTMYKAIRHTGARQPIACGLFDSTGRDDLIDAMADSRCEAVTTGTYAGAWDKVGDGVNYLPWAVNEDLDARLNSKARLIYEFDGIKTLGSYLYPAFARRFRHFGAQIASMFQYDSSSTAEWNTDWDAHYLNLRYTPAKAVSFAIAGRVFAELPRGSTFPTEGAEQVFGSCAVSFDRNLSVYSSGTDFMSTGPLKGWNPRPFHGKPEYLMGVGDSQFVSYTGSGAYTLQVDYLKRGAVLEVCPDADVVGDPWHPDAKKSAVVLKDRPQQFTWKIPGLSLASANHREGAMGYDVPVKDNSFEVKPGKYYLRW